MTTSPARDLSIDALKSFSIFGVVFIHASWLLCDVTRTTDFLMAVFRIGVPCFLVLWAYFVEKAILGGRDMRTHLFKNFRRLFVTFVCWSNLYIFLNGDTTNLTAAKAITGYWMGNGWAGQFFFVVLFQLILLFPLLRKILSRPFWLSATMLLVVCVYGFAEFCAAHIPPALAKLGDLPFIFWIPFALAGIALARGGLQWDRRWTWTALLVIPCEYFLLIHFQNKYPSYITLGVLLGGILLCISVVGKQITSAGKVADLTHFIGSNTMTIFVANPLVISAVHQISGSGSVRRVSEGESFFLSVAVTLLVTALCLLIAFLINKTQLRGILN